MSSFDLTLIRDQELFGEPTLKQGNTVYWVYIIRTYDIGKIQWLQTLYIRANSTSPDPKY